VIRQASEALLDIAQMTVDQPAAMGVAPLPAERCRRSGNPLLLTELAIVMKEAHPGTRLVEAILQGRQPAELTLERLLDDLPLDWAAQREALGPI